MKRIQIIRTIEVSEERWKELGCLNVIELDHEGEFKGVVGGDQIPDTIPPSEIDEYKANVRSSISDILEEKGVREKTPVKKVRETEVGGELLE